MRYTLKLGFDAKSGGADWEEMNAGLISRVRPLLAKIDAIEKGPVSVTAELTPQNCNFIIDLLCAAERNGDKLYDVRMEECAGSNDPGASEWFVLWPRKDMEREVPSKNGLNAIKADRIRGNEQIRAFHGADSNVDCFVSEKARTAIEKARLRGLEFIWARDAGKFQAPQWYHVFATPPLGRGLDHPWFDPQAYGQTKGLPLKTQPADPQWRRGVTSFNLSQLRNNAKAGSGEMTELLHVLRSNLPMSSNGFTRFHGLYRVLREFLPKADFAYTWMFSMPPDMEWSYRHPAYLVGVNATARTKLLSLHLVTSEDFQPVIVLDRPPAAAEVLDNSAVPKPGPAFAGERLERVRADEREARKKFDANPKPEKPADLKPALATLKRLQKTHKWPQGAKSEDIKAAERKLRLKIPPRWAEVLAVANGFHVEEAGFGGGEPCRIASTQELPEVHQKSRYVADTSQSGLAAQMLGVADTPLADAIFLDTSKINRDGDCPLLLLDHETGETAVEWPNIPSFLTELFTRRTE